MASAKREMVVETREVVVEKVVLTLDMEQAEFIVALLRRTSNLSPTEVAGMVGVLADLKDTVNDYNRFSTKIDGYNMRVGRRDG